MSLIDAPSPPMNHYQTLDVAAKTNFSTDAREPHMNHLRKELTDVKEMAIKF